MGLVGSGLVQGTRTQAGYSEAALGSNTEGPVPTLPTPGGVCSSDPGLLADAFVNNRSHEL